MITSLYCYTKDNPFDYFSCHALICEQCGQDHSFRPSFEDLNTSIDIVPKLLAPRKEESLECILTMKNRNRGAR